MKEQKFLFLAIQQLVLLFYFVVTTVIFFLALQQGNDGVSLRLFGGGDDGYFYWEQAKNIAEGKDAILTSVYPLIIGYLLKITGFESVYVIRLFNYVGFVMLVLFGLYLNNIFYNFETRDKENNIYISRILILIIFLCYVSLIMNVTLSIYRDVWIYLMYLVSVVCSIHLIFIRRKEMLFIILLFLSICILGLFRKYAVLSFLIAIIIYFLYQKIKIINRPMNACILLLVLGGVYYTFFVDFNVPLVNMSLRDVLNYRNYFIEDAAGGSQMWINLDQSTFAAFIINYLHSYLGNLLGPLPWHIRGITTLFVFITETIIFCVVLFILWKKRRALLPVQKYVLLHAFVWISMIALSNDNIGAATRLRPVAWILILIVFASIYPKIYTEEEKRGEGNE